MENIADGSNEICMKVVSEHEIEAKIIIAGVETIVTVKKVDEIYDIEVAAGVWKENKEFSILIYSENIEKEIKFMCEDAGEENIVINKQDIWEYKVQGIKMNKAGVEIATRTRLGVIKVGENLGIMDDGRLFSEQQVHEIITNEDIDSICK